MASGTLYYNIKKDEQMGSPVLYSRCLERHYDRCVKF